MVPVDRSKLVAQLNEGYCDIVMSGIVVTPQRAEAVRLSSPYLDVTLAFVVQDYRRGEFSSREALQNLEALKLAILDIPYFISICPRAPAQGAAGDREFRKRILRI